MRFLLILALLLSSVVFAQNKPYYHAVKTNLSEYTISSICQDKQGRLILGTDKGILTFNGFKTSPIPTQQLSSKELISMINVGRTIVGLTKTGQLFELKNNGIELINVGQFSEPIRNIKSSVNGELYLMAETVIYVCKLNPFSLIRKVEVPFAEKGKTSIIDYLVTQNNQYALLSSNELVDIKEDMAMGIPSQRTRWLLEAESTIMTIPFDPSSYPIYRFQKNRFVRAKKISGGINHEIVKVENLGNQLAMLSKTGVMVIDKASFAVTSSIVGFHVTSIFKDRSNTIWFGTKGRGLFCIPTGAFQLVNSAEYQSIDFLRQFNSLSVENLSGLKSQLSLSGKQMIGAGNKSIDFTVFNMQFSLPFIWQDEVVKQFISLSKDTFAMLSSKGVFRFQAKNAKEFRKFLAEPIIREQLSDASVKEWAYNSKHELLFSSTDGIHWVNLLSGEHKKITFFNENIDASQIVADEKQWYVLTPDSRLYIIQNKQIIRDINFRNYRNNIPVKKIKKEGDYFYLLADNALYRTKEFKGEFERLGELDKLSDLTLRDFAVVKNNVYLATQFGIFKIFWKNVQTVFPELIVGKPYGDFQKKKTVEFSFQNTHISIPFELIDLTINHPFILEYRLIQDNNTHDESWHKALVSSNELSFEHLRSGDYQLQIRLSDPGSTSHSSPLSTHFSIESAWYEQSVLWLLTGAIIGGFGTIYLLREKRRFKKAQIRKNIVRRKKG
jgi:hypothetical protein